MISNFVRLGAQTNDSHLELYELSSKQTSRGEVSTSKAAPGYIVLHDGTKVEGEIKITLVKIGEDGERNLQGITLQTPAKRLDLQPMQVTNYGLQITINEYLSKRKKPAKAPGVNFHPGSITLLDGKVLTGQIAFNSGHRIWKSSTNEYYYHNVLFTDKPGGYLKFYESKYLDGATQTINNKEITYQYLDNRFIPMGAMDTAMEFRPGRLQIVGNNVREGLVGIHWSNKLHANEVYLKDETGKLSVYRSPGLESFSWGTENYASTQGTFVRVEKENVGFQVYRNPFPTTESGLGFLASLVVDAATGAVAKEVLKTATGTGGEKNKEFNKKMGEATDAELTVAEYTLEVAQNSIPDDAPNAAKQKADIAARRLAIRGNRDIRNQVEQNIQEGGTVKIMKKEWILLNKQTGEETVILQDKFRDRIEPVLFKFSKYALLSKKEKRELLKWDNLDQIMHFLGTCVK
jgi:hypothetical protein